MTENQDFSVVEGNTKRVIIEINQDGVSDILDGARFVWQCGDIRKTGFVDNISINFTINPEDTQSKAGKMYKHEAQITDSIGNVSTVSTGMMKILNSIID